MTHQITSYIVFLGQDYDRNTERGFRTAKWQGINRVERAWYKVRHDADLSVETLAEEAFHVFNAPDECLSENQLRLRGEYQGPCLNVGDVVQVRRNGVLYAEALCLSQGWHVQHTCVVVQ